MIGIRCPDTTALRDASGRLISFPNLGEAQAMADELNGYGSWLGGPGYTAALLVAVSLEDCPVCNSDGKVIAGSGCGGCADGKVGGGSNFARVGGSNSEFAVY